MVTFACIGVPRTAPRREWALRKDDGLAWGHEESPAWLPAPNALRPAREGAIRQDLCTHGAGTDLSQCPGLWPLPCVHSASSPCHMEKQEPQRAGRGAATSPGSTFCVCHTGRSSGASSGGGGSGTKGHCQRACLPNTWNWTDSWVEGEKAQDPGAGCWCRRPVLELGPVSGPR